MVCSSFNKDVTITLILLSKMGQGAESKISQLSLQVNSTAEQRYCTSKLV